MTVVFDSVHCNLQTIELSEVSGDEACIWVFLLSACKWISFFWWFDMILSSIIIVALGLFWNNVNVNLVRIASEESLD